MRRSQHASRRADVLAYLPKEWREFAALPGNGRTVSIAPPAYSADHPDGTNKRLDAFPSDGGDAGSSYEQLRDQLLDPYTIQQVVLLHDGGGQAALPNGDFAAAVCSASNDWMRERWLDASGDDRLSAAILVPANLPDVGAAEIRRVGADERFVSAYVAHNSLAKPLGHPLYHPIYEAAEEMDLPIQLHISGGEFQGGSAPPIAGAAHHHFRFDVYVVTSQATVSHITSMLVHGVFEKYPSLRLLVAEPGIAWIPWLAMTLDSNADLLRQESRWVRRRPSDYLRDHVRFTTQPCEALLDERQELVDHLELVEGIEDMLCFSSDYPHWDTDVPTFVTSVLPSAWHSKLFHDNARRMLRTRSMDSPVVAGAAPAAGPEPTTQFGSPQPA